MRKKIKLLLVLMSVLLLTGVGYAMADTSTGTVNVTPEIARISDVIFPESVDPNTWTTLSFVIEFGQGISGGDMVYVHLFKSGSNPDLPNSGIPTTLGINHLCARWSNAIDGDNWEALGGSFTNFVQPVTGPITDGSDIPLGLDVMFAKTVDIGDWEMRILLNYYVKPPVDETRWLWDTTLFQMNGFMEVAINFATFDFGDIEQGQVEIPISTPLCGYLNLTVTSNVAYAVQVSGTDPTKDPDSFGVDNILANSLNDVGSAVPLTLILADLANLGSQAAGSAVVHRIYLWISIPISAPVGMYTFTLTVSVVPA